MDLIRAEVVAVALAVGVLSLAIATTVATRHEPAVRGRRMRGLAPLVPWLGGLLVLVLLVRGSTAGAVIVLIATVLHAVVIRASEALRNRSLRRRAGPRRSPGRGGRGSG
jgi:hypothetical protein